LLESHKTVRKPRYGKGEIMKIRWALLTSTALALGVAPAATAYADHNEAEENEREVSPAAIPAPALATLKAEAAGAPIVKYEQATEYGKTVYSAHVKTAKGIIEVVVDPSGKLLRKGPEADED
jgi:hypothetical protein